MSPRSLQAVGKTRVPAPGVGRVPTTVWEAKVDTTCSRCERPIYLGSRLTRQKDRDGRLRPVCEVCCPIEGEAKPHLTFPYEEKGPKHSCPECGGPLIDVGTEFEACGWCPWPAFCAEDSGEEL